MPQSTSTIQVIIGGKSSGLIGAANNALKALTGLGVGTVRLTANFTKLSVAMGKIPFAASGSVLGRLARSVTGLDNALSAKNKTLALSANYYRGLVGQVVSLNRFINVLGSSVRQVGQGLQNFATVFSLYVSLPVTGFITSMTRGLIDFQDKLIAVRRSTGMSTEDVYKLGQAIQEYSLMTSTTPVDLATQAEAWGRLGITGVNTIARLVAESDKLALATNLTSEQVVDDIGKIGSIYFKTSQEFVDAYPRIGSALNELGQMSAVSETEILSSLMRFLPTAKQLEMSLADAMALATVGAERSASPERAGTQMARALTEQVSKVEKFAEALNISRQEVLDLIDTDPIGFFIGVAEAINKIESPSQRIAATEELFGGVGGKTFNALVSNLEGFYKAQRVSNQAYEEGISLQKEYERSLDSVKVQLGVLQNSFRYLGYTIAEEVLPYITEFAFITIAAMRHVTAAFKQLDERTKLLIVGFGVLIAVLGPLTLFVGSLLFSIGIITTGITALMTQVIGVGGALAKFGLTMVALVQPFNIIRLAALAFIGTLVYLYNATNIMGASLSDLLGDLFTWGASLFTSFADGILSSTSVVYGAVTGVINGFVGLLEAFSPPKEGPLQNIDKWGSSIMESFAEGISRGNLRPVEERLLDLRRMFLNASGDGFITIGGEGAINPASKPTSDSLKTGARPGKIQIYSQMPDEYPQTPTNIQSYANATTDLADASEDAAESTNSLANAVESVTVALAEGQRIVGDYIITIGAKFSDAFAGAIRALGPEATASFSDVFSMIRSAIESYGSNMGLEAEEMQDLVMRGADAALALMQAFEGGGNIAGALSGIADITNGLASDIEAAVSAQLSYNQANEELEDIRKRLSNFDEEINNEIAAISRREDLTMDERAALIRQIRQRSQARRQELEDEVETQEEIVKARRDAMQEQKDIFNILNGLVLNAQKTRVPTDDNDVPVLGGLPDTTKVEENRRLFEKSAEDLKESVGTFFNKIEDASDIWKGFWAAITGESIGDLGVQSEKFWEGFLPGKEVYTNMMVLFNFINSVMGFVRNNVTYIVQTLKDFGKDGALTGYMGGAFDTENLNKIQKIFYTLGYAFGSFARGVENFIIMLEPAISNLITIFDDGIKTFQALLGKDPNMLPNFSFGEMIVNLFSSIFGGMYYEDIQNQTGVTKFAKNVGSIILDVFRAIFTNNTFWSEFQIVIKSLFQNMILNIFGILSEVLIGSPDENGIDRKGLLEFAMDFFDYLVSLFDFSNFDIEQMSNIATNIINGIIVALNTIDTKQFSSVVSNIIKGITDAVAGIEIARFNLLASNIFKAILEIIGSVDVAGLTTKAGQILVNLIAVLASLDYTSLTTKLIDFLSSLIGAIADIPFVTVGTKIAEIINNLLDAINTEMQSDGTLSSLTKISEGIAIGIATGIANIDWLLLGDTFISIAGAIVDGIKIAFLRLIGNEWLADNYVTEEEYKNNYREKYGREPITLQSLGSGIRTAFDWAWGGISQMWSNGNQSQPSNNYSEESQGGLGGAPSGGGGGGFGPMPAPRVTPDQIEESAAEFVTGFNTRISSPESVESASSSWNNFGIRLTQTTAPYTNTVGTNMAANLVTGFSTNFQVDSTQTSYNEILFSLNRWLLANASNLQKVGNSISSQIIGGINTGLNQGTLNISRFLYNSSESMKFVGYNIGVDLIRGMVKAIAENKAFLVMAIDRPLEIDLFNYEPNPYSGRAIQDLLEVTTGAASVAASSTPSAAGTSVNITIQGNVIGNQAFITEVTNAVMESLRRSGRLT